MHAVDVIDRKRRGEELTREEIEFMVMGFTRGEVEDYQMAAWLMAVVLQSMTERETVDLTMIMAESGDVLDLAGLGGMVVDKHSTGGVGDKTTLVVAPLVASLGLKVGKMSGRGLGFTGGTLDKLEAIPGFNVNLSRGQFIELIRNHGIVVAGQSADLAPADGAIYALRDVTATVASLPLIASSIMSKKIAAGANAIVLDVKTGSGAFMETEDAAVELAEAMIKIGRSVGRRMAATISDMGQPLGYAIGNALEVVEAVDTLKGNGPSDFTEHCEVVAAEMLLLADACPDAPAGRAMVQDMISSGRALSKFREWIRVQGGDDGVVDDPTIMPQAAVVDDLAAPKGGYVAAIDAREAGLATVGLGAGRQHKGERIDHAVGVVLRKKVGDCVRKGEALLAIHASDEEKLEEASQRLLSSFRWSDTPVQAPSVVLRVLR